MLQSDQLSTAQSVAKGLKTSDWFLRILVVLGFGLAIWLARGPARAGADGLRHRTRRSRASRRSIIRSIAGGTVVDDLATTEAVRPAATAAWDIGTELLTTLAWSTVFVGIPAIIVGLLLGPYEWAKDLRARMAGVAHDRPEFLYGGAVLDRPVPHHLGAGPGDPAPAHDPRVPRGHRRRGVRAAQADPRGDPTASSRSPGVAARA